MHKLPFPKLILWVWHKLCPWLKLCIWYICSPAPQKKRTSPWWSHSSYPMHGCIIFSHPLAGTSSQRTGRGLFQRFSLNYVNRLRKKLISILIYFISFFNHLPTRSPQNWCNCTPLMSPSGHASCMIPPPSCLHVSGWLSCQICRLMAA